MSIEVHCECGKVLRVEERHAGKKVRCSQCQALVSIPEKDNVQGYDLAAFVTCPQCDRHWEPGTAVCIDCGWNFRTGKPMKTKYRLIDRVLPGSYSWFGFEHRLVLTRGQDGILKLKLFRKLFFIRRKTVSIKLADYQQIVTDYKVVDNGQTVTEEYRVDLEGVRRRSISVYRGSNQVTMKETIDMLQAAAPHLNIIPRN